MWSVRNRLISSSADDHASRCKVCRKQTVKILAKELKVTRVLLIPVSKTNEYFEICPDCRSRVRVKKNDQLLDTKT